MNSQGLKLNSGAVELLVVYVRWPTAFCFRKVHSVSGKVGVKK